MIRTLSLNCNGGCTAMPALYSQHWERIVRIIAILIILSWCNSALAENHTYPTLAPVAKRRIANESRKFLVKLDDTLRHKELHFREIRYSYWAELNQEGVVCRFDVTEENESYTPVTHTNCVSVLIAPNMQWNKSMAYGRFPTRVPGTAWGKGTENYPNIAPVQCDKIIQGALGMILSRRPNLTEDDLTLKTIHYSFSRFNWLGDRWPGNLTEGLTEGLEATFEAKKPFMTKTKPGYVVPSHKVFTVRPAYRDNKGRLHPATLDESEMSHPVTAKNKDKDPEWDRTPHR